MNLRRNRRNSCINAEGTIIFNLSVLSACDWDRFHLFHVMLSASRSDSSTFLLFLMRLFMVFLGYLIRCYSKHLCHHSKVRNHHNSFSEKSKSLNNSSKIFRNVQFVSFQIHSGFARWWRGGFTPIAPLVDALTPLFPANVSRQERLVNGALKR